MLEQSFIIALLVLAIHYVFQEGEIFGFMQRFSHWKIAPALFDCNVCMSPWYGSVLYVIIYGVNWHWPIVVLCAMGINAAINKMSPKERVDITNHY
jgi:hypothetical protein